MGKLNSQITTIEIGVRSLREVTIFPLSLADQTKTARILAKVFQEVMEKLSSFGAEDKDDLEKESFSSMAKQLSDVDVLEFIVSAIQDNLEIILKLVVDKSETISMEELTNDQFYRLAEVIYEVNYEATSKNFVALLRRVRGAVSSEKKTKKKESHLKKSLPQSVGTTATG